jgi:hypothetical protein
MEVKLHEFVASALVDVSGQFHTPATLPPVSIEKKAHWPQKHSKYPMNSI